MKRYIIYTRVSTKKQTVENQLFDCRNYVNQIKDPQDQVIEFCEPDKSTMLPLERRHRLMAMLKTLRQGDNLIVYKVDRLARHPQELINIYFKIVKDLKVNLISIRDQHINDQNICIYAFIASSERDSIQKRTADGLKRKKENRERVGSTLYGFKLDKTKLQTREHVPSTGKPYLLIPDEEESKQVDLMITLYNKGYSYSQIAEELKERGFMNRKGNPIHKKSVWKILDRLGIRRPSLAYLGNKSLR